MYGGVGPAAGGAGTCGVGWVHDAQWMELDTRECGGGGAYDMLVVLCKPTNKQQIRERGVKGGVGHEGYV